MKDTFRALGRRAKVGIMTVMTGNAYQPADLAIACVPFTCNLKESEEVTPILRKNMYFIVQAVEL